MNDYCQSCSGNFSSIKPEKYVWYKKTVHKELVPLGGNN